MSVISKGLALQQGASHLQKHLQISEVLNKYNISLEDTFSFA
jgi:hypothetical protein